LDLNLRKKLAKVSAWSIYLYSAETWTLRKADQKYSESFKMWCWRRKERASWTDRVRNKKVLGLHRIKEQLHMLQTIRRKKAKCVGHNLRGNCLLKHAFERQVDGRVEVTGRRGRRTYWMTSRKRENIRN